MYDLQNILETINLNENFFGGMIGGLSGVAGFAAITIVLTILLAIYVYFAMAWMTIGKKLKYKNAWLAWIPIANISMMLQLGGFHWAWIFLILIPILGWIALWVLVIIAVWKVFEKRNYPGWFSLSMIIPRIGSILYLVAIGFVAWKDRGIMNEIQKKVTRKSSKKKSQKR